MMERAVLLAPDRWITPEELPSRVVASQRDIPSIYSEDTLSIKEATKQMQQTLIRKALQKTGGNRTKAAELLEVSRPMLISKIKEYHL